MRYCTTVVDTNPNTKHRFINEKLFKDREDFERNKIKFVQKYVQTDYRIRDHKEISKTARIKWIVI